MRTVEAREAAVVDPWPEPYTDFIAAHDRQLFRFAYLVAGSRADAEDAVQEAVIKVSAHWHKLRPEGALAYLRKAITNELLQSRRRRRETPVGLRMADVSADAAGLLRMEEDQAFVARLQNLPPKQRAAIVLRYYCDLSDNEISTYLHCTTATVRSQIHRALAQLREHSNNDSGDQ